MASVPWARRPGRRWQGIYHPAPARAVGPGECGSNCLSWELGPVPGGREASQAAKKNASMMLGLYGLSRVVVVLRAIREEGARARSSTPAGSYLARLLAQNQKIRRAARLERARSRIDPGRNTCKTRA